MKKRRSEKEFRYPHNASGRAARQRLATFLVEQQKPDFNAQDHNFNQAAGEFRKALNWAERATQKP